MKKLLIIALGVLLSYATSAQAPGVEYWSASELKELQKTMPSKMNAQKSASQLLTNVGTHLIQVSYREASGEAEVHETVADIFVVQNGEATLVSGGKVVGGKTSAPGEIRGASVAEGQKRDLRAGDVVNIPAGTPHQLVLQNGKSFTYLIVKVPSK